MTLTVDSFRQARWHHPGRLKPLRLIVLHATQGSETSRSAEAVQAMFVAGDRKASAHVSIDTDTVAGSVHPTDTAFAAAGANSDGYHIEQCGRSEQTPGQWDDAASRAIVERAARHVAEASSAFAIPIRRLTVAQVADGRTKGLTDHATCSKAFPNVSTGHWDPGPNYPWGRLLQLAAGTPAPTDPEDEPVRLTYVLDKAAPNPKPVYLAARNTKPLHVTVFKDAEHLAMLSGDVVVQAAVDTIDVPDAAGTVRKVLVLGSDFARRYYGLA